VAASEVGHVVELDPFEPQSVPVKRNALGRLGARDVAAALAADGRAVVFMADGREGGFLWRFVSEGPAQEPNALDQGTLYAARFEAGALRWIALPADAEPYGAAVARGANSLGRPMALALDPNGARLCLALRETARNPAGAVVEMLFAARNPAADTAIVESLIEGRTPPRPRAGREPATVPAWPAAPTSLCLDTQGNLLLGTAQPARDSPLPDALYVLPVEGPARGQPSLAYVTPLGAALGGVAVVPGAAAWIAGVAHPGAGMGAQFATPRSRWPHFRDGEPPRGGVVALSHGG
jgi:secreted PhoX family phosphatase